MGKITQEEFRSLARAAAKLQNVPFYIDDTPGLTIAALRTRARRLKRQKGIGLIIVDYLQLLQGAGKNSNDNRVQEISEISRGLKTLAKELNVPVMALSQLSRAVEQRENKRPQLADLRESGSIEQDADIVMFIYREEYYLSFQKPTEATEGDDAKDVAAFLAWQEAMAKKYGLAELIVAKQRHGSTGTLDLHFEAASPASPTAPTRAGWRRSGADFASVGNCFRQSRPSSVCGAMRRRGLCLRAACFWRVFWR